ncbi:MAG TPA: serine protease, partial [Polyangiaceae bacterium]|nr:serine protease [Polyangiaceae bacterium]
MVGCGAEAPGEFSATLGQNSEAFVNGGDDRREYFELAEPAQRAALEQFTVALMTDSAAAALTGGHVGVLPTWSEINSLCDGEPFGDQPAAAFCSGVLVDWDLVLTSGHCVSAIPQPNLRVAFNYYYQAEGELAMRDEDVYPVGRVVVSRRDDPTPNDQGERLDFAWVELERPAAPPHRPAPTYTRSRGASESDRVISIGAGGGVPIKWDEGGRVRSTRSEFDDYLIADTDTSQGSSGGGIFDEDLVVLGSLARGAADFARTDAGCYVTSSESDPTLAREQFTYVHRAVEALCAAGSSSVLCDDACGEPCDAGALEPLRKKSDDSGCSFAASAPRGHDDARGLGVALFG